MNFQPVSQNGITPPSQYRTRDSDFAFIVSTTSTLYGNPVILKAVSNAQMYKTVPVTFYSLNNSISTSTPVVLGTSTFSDNISAVLVTSFIPTGTNRVYAIWPGENAYAAKSTEGVPNIVTVAVGPDIGGSLTLSSSPNSNSIVEGEGSVTFTAHMTTGTALTNNIYFYADGQQIANVTMQNNYATVTVSNLTAGTHQITASWPGITLSGTTYAGKTSSVNYTVKAGTTILGNMSLTATNSYGVVNEYGPSLVARINTSTNLTGLGQVSFYNNSQLVGQSSVIANNYSTLQVNALSLGTSTLYAVWDGNSSSHPRYLPITSNSIIFNEMSRATIPNLTLTLTSDETAIVYGFSNITLTANANLPASQQVVGDIEFLNGTGVLTTATFNNNVATVTIPAPNTGTYSVSAYYAGSETAPKFYSTQTTATQFTVQSAFSLAANQFSLTTPGTSLSEVNLQNQQYTVSILTGTSATGVVQLVEVTPYTNTTGTGYNIGLNNFAIRSGTDTSVTLLAEASNQSNGYQSYDVLTIDWQNTEQYWIEISTNIPLVTNEYISLGNSFPFSGDASQEFYTGSGEAWVPFYDGSITRAQGSGYYHISRAVYFSETNISRAWLTFQSGVDVLDWSTPQTGDGAALPFSNNGHVVGQGVIGPNDRGYAVLPTWPYSVLDYRGRFNGEILNPIQGTLYDFGNILSSGWYRLNTAYQYLITETHLKLLNSAIVSNGTNYQLLGQSSFNNNTTTTVTLAPGALSTDSTHVLQAIWSGGYIDGLPYYGIASNTATLQVTTASLALTGNSIILNGYPVSLTAQAYNYTGTISGSGQVNLYNSGTLILSTASSGDTAQFVIPAYTLPIGTYTNITAAWSQTIPPLISNTLSLTVAPLGQTDITASLSTASYYAITSTGTTNTNSISVNVTLVGGFPGHGPTVGPVYLYDSQISGAIGNGYLDTEGQTATTTISWTPSLVGEITTPTVDNSSTRTLTLVYNGDSYNSSTQTSLSLPIYNKLTGLIPQFNQGPSGANGGYLQGTYIGQDLWYVDYDFSLNNLLAISDGIIRVYIDNVMLNYIEYPSAISYNGPLYLGSLGANTHYNNIWGNNSYGASSHITFTNAPFNNIYAAPSPTLKSGYHNLTITYTGGKIYASFSYTWQINIGGSNPIPVIPQF